jgi:hypothetical protein
MLQPLSIRLQIGICFFQLPLPVTPSAFLAVRLPPVGRDAGFTVFRSSDDNDDLAPACHTGSGHVRVPHRYSEAARCIAFWLKPVSAFGLSIITVLIAVYLW